MTADYQGKKCGRKKRLRGQVELIVEPFIGGEITNHLGDIETIVSTDFGFVVTLAEGERAGKGLIIRKVYTRPKNPNTPRVLVLSSSKIFEQGTPKYYLCCAQLTKEIKKYEAALTTGVGSVR